MQIHELKPKNKIKQKKRIARGGKKGTYSGKGIKGQKARAGAKMPPMIRELIKRYPKLRGYRFSSIANDIPVLNISTLGKIFNDGDKVSGKILKEKGIIKKSGGNRVKILGKGELNKKLHIEKCEVSLSAKEKIEKAGGSVNKETS